MADGAARARPARSGRLRDRADHGGGRGRRGRKGNEAHARRVSRRSVGPATGAAKAGRHKKAAAETAVAFYAPPVSNVSVQGLSGCWSVPRIPSTNSTFNVRKRSSGFVKRTS